ncbi:hypothetical protein C3B59_05675 [Cryobacterium zongtaii]|uniref:Uncharacterized protein n=1 Tax=Cryobacterium zongtaii TaxID=1259217 RepID=A0A2S3ZLF6_9MICO|nr:hypothetical protein C3B59_05675 [Cryobacterium zongtaii]
MNPRPPLSRCRLSFSRVNARSNQPSSSARAPRSQIDGVSRSSTITTPPVAPKPRSRDIFHARPILRTWCSGQYTAYVIARRGTTAAALTLRASAA